jgi:hypothetical protein
MRYTRLVVVVLVLLSGLAFGASGLREAKGRAAVERAAKAQEDASQRPGWTSFATWRCCTTPTPERLAEAKQERTRQMRRASHARPPFAFGGRPVE